MSTFRLLANIKVKSFIIRYKTNDTNILEQRKKTEIMKK